MFTANFECTKIIQNNGPGRRQVPGTGPLTIVIYNYSSTGIVTSRTLYFCKGISALFLDRDSRVVYLTYLIGP